MWFVVVFVNVIVIIYIFNILNEENYILWNIVVCEILFYVWKVCVDKL